MSYQVGDKVINILDSLYFYRNTHDISSEKIKTLTIGTVVAKPMPNDIYYVVKLPGEFGLVRWQAALMKLATEEEVLLYEVQD